MREPLRDSRKQSYLACVFIGCRFYACRVAHAGLRMRCAGRYLKLGCAVRSANFKEFRKFLSRGVNKGVRAAVVVAAIAVSDAVHAVCDAANCCF